MGQDEVRRGRLARLALKVGTVAGAAAALLSDASGAQAADGNAPHPDRIDSIPTIARDSESPAQGSPPPLVLKPSRMGGRIIMAGHKSHSSHSSHSSHVSGAGFRAHSSHTSHVSGARHSSHFSSTTRSGSGSYRSGSSSSGSSSRSSAGSSSSVAPSSGWTAPAPASPEPRPIPKPDLTNPLARYQLLTIGTYGAIQKAFIKDLLVGQPKLVKVGEKVGDSELVSIAADKQSVRMKPPAKDEFVLKLMPSAR